MGQQHQNMQYLPSLLIFSICFIVVTANRPRICLNNGAPCNVNGTLYAGGNCCSRNCVQESGQTIGRCQTIRATRQAEQCLEEATRCSVDDSKGKCCSGICLQNEGSSEGVCGPIIKPVEPVVIPPVEPNPQCLFNGAPCQTDNSQGDCCSGLCVQKEGESSGICRKQGEDSGSQENEDTTDSGEDLTEENSAENSQQEETEENSQEQGDNSQGNDEQ